MSKDQIIVYTDGSCNPKQQMGGWAAILLVGNEKIVLKGTAIETSHHRMEIIAVLKAIEYIKNNDLKLFPIIIYTDSQYVSDFSHRKNRLLNNDFSTKNGAPVRNSDLVQQLIEYINEFESLEFVKIPSHGKKLEGPNYNREVDILSRKEVRISINFNKTKNR